MSATRTEHDADARLIAAAPSMLLALAIARAHMRQAIDETPEAERTLCGALALVDEAIEHATGGNLE